MESEPEFRLPADGLDSASGAAERLDAVCGDSEQAEDFCDHGAGILAGLVGQKLSYPNTPPRIFSKPGAWLPCVPLHSLGAGDARLESLAAEGICGGARRLA
jgi:hypothetical protein